MQLVSQNLKITSPSSYVCVYRVSEKSAKQEGLKYIHQLYPKGNYRGVLVIEKQHVSIGLVLT